MISIFMIQEINDASKEITFRELMFQNAIEDITDEHDLVNAKGSSTHANQKSLKKIFTFIKVMC